jgi:hypothetical protein
MTARLRTDVETKIRRLHDDLRFSYRQIAMHSLLPERDAATLCNIVGGKHVSRRNLRRIARALGVEEERRSYTPRPVTTKEQEQRRAALGAQWRDVIDAGLAALEMDKEHTVMFDGQEMTR